MFGRLRRRRRQSRLPISHDLCGSGGGGGRRRKRSNQQRRPKRRLHFGSDVLHSRRIATMTRSLARSTRRCSLPTQQTKFVTCHRLFVRLLYFLFRFGGTFLIRRLLYLLLRARSDLGLWSLWPRCQRRREEEEEEEEKGLRNAAGEQQGNASLDIHHFGVRRTDGRPYRRGGMAVNLRFLPKGTITSVYTMHLHCT